MANIKLQSEEPTIYFPVETNVKGLQSFTIHMDGIELDETGFKIVDGKQVFFYKFKLINYA